MAQRLYSLEFFPPRTPEGVEKLRAARRQLGQLKPAFCSVTFGAGGSTRDGTLETVLEIRGEGIAAVGEHDLGVSQLGYACGRFQRAVAAADDEHVLP